MWILRRGLSILSYRLQRRRHNNGVNIFAKSQLEKKFNAQFKEVLARNNLKAPTIRYQVKSVKKKIISRETTMARAD